MPAPRSAVQVCALLVLCLVPISPDWQRLSAQADPAIPAPTAEQQVRLKERDRLLAEAQKHLAAGKLAEAIAAGEKVVAIEREVLGMVHTKVALSLAWLAQMYEERDDFDAARRARQEVLAIRTQLLGAQHWRVTDARLALADVDRRARLAPEQRQQLREAEQLDRQAEKLYDQGQYREATPLAERAVALRKEVLGDHHAAYATSLHNLAYRYLEQAKYARAEALYREALQVRKEILGERHPAYASTLNDLALLYRTQGDFARANLYLQASQLFKEILGERHSAYATSLHNLAALAQERGDYGQAETLYRQTIRLRKEILGERHADYASSLNGLAGVYDAQGDYPRAEPLYRQALQITTEVFGERHPAHARSLNNLAALYYQQGDYARAEPLYRQALQITTEVFGERHPHYAISLDNLAALYQKQGDFARAEPLHRQALQVRKQVLGERHPDYAVSLHNLAGVYQAQADYTRAEPLLRQALALVKELFGERHPAYANCLHSLAFLYQEQRDFARAEPLYRQVLQLRKEILGERHPAYASSLNNLAALYHVQGDAARAAALLREGLRIERGYLGHTAAIQSEHQQLVMAESLRGNLGGYLSVAVAAAVPAERLYDEVLSLEGAVFARQQALRRLQQTPEARERPEVGKLLHDLQRTTRDLSTVAHALPDPRQPDRLRRELERLGAEVERLEAALASASPAFQQLQEQQRRTTAAVCAALPEGGVLIDLFEYVHFQPAADRTGKLAALDLAAFVVRREQPVQWVELGPVCAIECAIDEWRAHFGLARPGRQDGAAAELRRLVWDKVAEHAAGAKLVLLSPDGATGRFPWAALPGKEAGSYLIEEVPLAIVPVPQLLPELLATPTARTAEPSLLLVGEVAYDAAPGTAAADGHAAPRGGRASGLPAWQPLPGTQREVAAIKDLFQRRYKKATVTDLRDDEATEAAVREQAPRHRYLHLATHGYFAPPALRSALAANSRLGTPEVGSVFSVQDVAGFHPGLLSGLVLAGANRPIEPDQDDGILTAVEVQALDLFGVELAVLSACETGLGETAGGEGLLGLQRAFQVAGAKSVVATLWSVRDDAARSLMTDFYDNLWKKKLSKAEALRQAQLTLLREGIKRGLVREQEPDEGQRLSPYYWAAFTLSGDWR